MRVECIVRITRADDTHLTLSREEAEEIYDALHAEFGDFDQARELSQLARESVSRELKLAELEAEVLSLKAAGVDDADISALTSPSLQDDIEAMIAKSGTTEDDADEQEAEFLSRLPVCDPLSTPIPRFTGRTVGEVEFRPDGSVTITDVPSNTPEPPAEPETVEAKETDEQKVLRLWNRERTKWTADTDARIVSRVRSHFKHLTNGDVYDLLRGQGVEVARPLTRAECAKSARAARHVPKPEPSEEQIERAVIKAMIGGRKPPEGYKIVNADAWRASESLLSDADIREMAEGGLARAGLALDTEAVGW